MKFSDLRKHAILRLLKMHFEAGVGHIGGNLSALDAMLYLHHFVMQKDDQFILSKGHAAGALYTTLWSLNKISDEQLKTFHKDQTKLAGHPPLNSFAEIPFATGSLGHGFGLACGVAMGNRLQKNDAEIFCLTSDGEWQEGSNFEALIFLNHHQLNNVKLLVDCNHLQGFGSTQEVASLDLERLHKVFAAFNFDIFEIDGHNENDLAKLSQKSARPQIFLIKTIKGHGVSFMQNQMQWHYLPLNEDLYNQAKKEIENL